MHIGPRDPGVYLTGGRKGIQKKDEQGERSDVTRLHALSIAEPGWFSGPPRRPGFRPRQSVFPVIVDAGEILDFHKPRMLESLWGLPPLPRQANQTGCAVMMYRDTVLLKTV
jgi:hypothetical protein